jgi:protein-disulfide isomerase
MKNNMKEKNKYIIAVMLIVLGVLLGLGVLYLGNYQAEKEEANLINSLPLPPQEKDIQNFELEDDNYPFIGDKDAPVTIIAINDYQCPFCKDFALQVMPQLKEKYVDKGKAKIVFRDFPLPYHPEAKKVAEAALCFYDQGLDYYDYYMKIFENATKIQLEHLKGYAKELEADTEIFNECLESEKFAETIVKDFEEINQSIQEVKIDNFGTPAFLINQEPLIGAHDFETFKILIGKQLEN